MRGKTGIEYGSSLASHSQTFLPTSGEDFRLARVYTRERSLIAEPASELEVYGLESMLEDQI